MPPKKRSTRAKKCRYMSPRDALNAYCSDVTNCIETRIRSSMVKGKKMPEGTYLIPLEAGGKDYSVEVLFSTPMCEFVKSTSKKRGAPTVKLRFSYRWKKAGASSRAKWRSRTMAFDVDTPSDHVIVAVLEDIAKKTLPKRYQG